MHTHTHIHIINYELIIHKKYIKTTSHIYMLYFKDVLKFYFVRAQTLNIF